MCTAFVSLQHLVTCFKCRNICKPEPCTIVKNRQGLLRYVLQNTLLSTHLGEMETLPAPQVGNANGSDPASAGHTEHFH